MKKTILCVLFTMLCACVLAQRSVPNSIPDSVLSVTKGTAQFALELLQTTSVEAGKYMNVAISPFSVWAVLSLLREGSAGRTNAQLQKALHLHENDKAIRAAFRTLNNAVHVSGSGVEMIGANALFTDVNRPLQWEFEYLAEKIYSSAVYPVNFMNPSASVNIINQWVANITHNRIVQLVQEEDLRDPHLVIANGNFFKGKWLYPFNSSDTMREKFYDDKGTELGEVDMMHQNGHFRFSRISELGSKVVELPYAGEQFSMIVVVPSGNTTVDAVLERISRIPIEKLYNHMITEDEEYPGAIVEVFLPRVVINSDFVLNKALEKLGIIDVFSDARADLSRISPHSTYLHKLIHKAEIVIDEEGTTASSTTGGVMTDRQTLPKIYANRPFAFFIVENSMKVIVFAGKVVNPHM